MSGNYPEGLEMFQEMSGNFRKCLGYGQEMAGNGQEMSGNGQELVRKWSGNGLKLSG